MARRLRLEDALLNLVRTGVLLAAMTGLFLAIGYLLGGTGGMMLAFLFALGTNAFAYWNSDKMVLRMYGAHPAEPNSQLVRLVERLAENAEIPMPKVYVIDNPQPNAFATGRDPQHASVCATTGLINMLSPQEIAGVLGHELGHVKHRDTLTMTITATLAGAIAMLANFALFFGGGRRTGIIGALALMILAPLAASLVQMAISRTREYEADRAGAEVSGHPMWLASALEKIERGAAHIANPAAQANPATAHLFIINPLAGAHGANMAGLFSTHPSTAERIARLKAMAGER